MKTFENYALHSEGEFPNIKRDMGRGGHTYGNIDPCANTLSLTRSTTEKCQIIKSTFKIFLVIGKNADE